MSRDGKSLRRARELVVGAGAECGFRRRRGRAGCRGLRRGEERALLASSGRGGREWVW